MFQSATLKLTGLYLLIIAVISIFFSVSLYRLSVRQLETGLERQAFFIQLQPGFQGNVDLPSLLAKQRQERLNEGEKGIIAGLVRSDLLILILGGVGSYFLARRTLKPIARAHEAQVRFTADASHELRTPIAAMQMEIEVALRDRKLTHPQATTLLKSNLEELAKLSGLAQGLLQLTRQEVKLPTELVNLDGVINEAIGRLFKAARQKQIAINTDVKTDLTIPGDQPSLVQLMVVLLDNAVKYSQAGTKISLSARTNDKEAILKVKDEGRGIKSTDLPHIFDRFYRTNTVQEKVEGYGLGLSIAKNIVLRHHGTITAESEIGKGSVFMIKLPMSRV